MAANSEVRCVADVGAILGEGPVWVAREEALYWVDIKGCKIFRLDRHGNVSRWDTPFSIASLVPRKGGGFIAGNLVFFARGHHISFTA